MQYISTRDREQQFSASQAIAKGLADDGGLLTPVYLPKLPRRSLPPEGGMGADAVDVYFIQDPGGVQIAAEGLPVPRSQKAGAVFPEGVPKPFCAPRVGKAEGFQRLNGGDLLFSQRSDGKHDGSPFKESSIGVKRRPSSEGGRKPWRS